MGIETQWCWVEKWRGGVEGQRGNGLKIGCVYEGKEEGRAKARGACKSSKGFIIYLFRDCGKIEHA